ncbi:MAG: tRNA(His) guanylyltransferase Thg1 family protein [bacterium]
MRFEELDERMRVFETTHDLSVLPGLLMVARLDGRGFTRLTHEVHAFEAPFDEKFRDHMVATTMHLMDCGFHTLFGHTQSDEISILIDRADDAFGRKLRKINSILAGEASAHFTLRLGAAAVFDCRVSELPGTQDVVDYFRWRQEDAARNALGGHCYWLLRKGGESVTAATQRLRGLNTEARNELLFQAGINFNDLPKWQKRGTGVLWETYERPGRNELTGETAPAIRRRLEIDYELPMKEAFEAFISRLIEEPGAVA